MICYAAALIASVLGAAGLAAQGESKCGRAACPRGVASRPRRASRAPGTGRAAAAPASRAGANFCPGPCLPPVGIGAGSALCRAPATGCETRLLPREECAGCPPMPSGWFEMSLPVPRTGALAGTRARSLHAQGAQRSAAERVPGLSLAGGVQLRGGSDGLAGRGAGG